MNIHTGLKWSFSFNNNSSNYRHYSNFSELVRFFTISVLNALITQNMKMTEGRKVKMKPG